MVRKTGLPLLVLFLQISVCACLECYTCTNVTQAADCLTVTKCPAGHICQTQRRGNTFSYGCVQTASCLSISNSGLSRLVVGRSTTGTGDCSACCESSNCNRQLCQATNQKCNDSGDVDCVSVGSFVNLCSNTDHAKMVCKNFCGLCNLVDGGWSHWSEWSLCSVTCNNGTETRTRQCSDPAPVFGGSNCTGICQEIRTCHRDHCPVHGGWDQWSPWGSCSVSCGIGLRHRTRNCSNPFPAFSGAYCNGEPGDYQLCRSPACQDGGWANWETWGPCSKSCETGVQTSRRSCSNPAPSLLGRPCAGDSVRVRTCAEVNCSDLTTQIPTAGSCDDNMYNVGEECSRRCKGQRSIDPLYGICGPDNVCYCMRHGR